MWSVSKEVNSGGQRKKKVKQNISLVYYKDSLVINKRASRFTAALQELAMCVFGAASSCEKSLVVF